MKTLAKRKFKALHPISVGIARKNIPRKSPVTLIYKRTIYGFSTPLTQEVTFEPTQKIGQNRLPGLLRLKITAPNSSTPYQF